MKIRMIALAGVAALALSTPAMANEGWYLGLGAGWDLQVNGAKATSVTVPTFTTKDKKFQRGDHRRFRRLCLK